MLRSFSRPTVAKIQKCPEPAYFVKWYRARVRRNLDELHDAGKSLRVFGFGVTEAQVNQKFKLIRGEWQPGDILDKLNECGIPGIDRKIPKESVTSESGLTIAIKPKDERSLRHE